jgi:two-component system cell cycle sensor histidine kinase/response regulator CckA
MAARHQRALVVDSDPERRLRTCASLLSRGHEIAAFADFDRAYESHRARPFLLAILAVERPADAFERCRALRVRPGVRALLLIVPAATASELADLLEAGATDVLIEPYDASAIDLRLLVAERKAAVQSLAESMLDVLPDLVFRITREGVFTDFHAPDWHDLYAPPERIIGAKVADLMPPDIAARTMAAVEKALSTRSLEVFEYTLPVPPGDEDYEARLVPLGPNEVLTLVRNVTSRRLVLEATRNLAALEERAQVQEKLLHVQKSESLGLLAGGIAHDFNNLLTAIMGHASVALLKLPESSAARPSIDALVAATRRAADLTQQLLAYSGKGRFQIRLIDLSEHIREIVTLLEAATPKQVQLRLELASSLPAIECDVAQIQQVVMNLVINATEAIGDQRGSVLVITGQQTIDASYPADGLTGEAPKPGDYVFVEVQDNGRGMDEATKQRVFDPFFTTKSTGRGLGLAAVLGIVRAHHGVMRIYSAVGHGTTFKVLFPAQSAPAETMAVSVREEPKGTGTVLIVDDEVYLRRAARSILEHYGFAVIEAESGDRALEVYEEAKGSIVAVLLDMTMPGISGEETFRRLRQIDPEVTVILSSGYNEIEATRRFTSKGLAGFLQKPYTAGQLGEYVAQVIAARKK